MRGSSVHPLLAVLAVLALVGIVAVASTGSTPSGTNDGRPPADVVLDTILSLLMVLLVPAAAILVYGLLQRKAVAEQYVRLRGFRTGLLGIMVVTAVFAFGIYRLRPPAPPPEAEAPLVPGSPSPLPPGQPAGPETTYEPSFAWLPVLVVLGLVAVATAAYVLASRRHGGEVDTAHEAADDVADALEGSLDDLRAEPDPRRAVVAAFARLERALASSGLPRHLPETAEEYVARVLGRLEVDRRPVRLLTDLFSTAKFSQHPVDVAMKESAIAALARIRDELREVAERRRQEEERAREARQQAVAS